jgi:hypothetical protein
MRVRGVSVIILTTLFMALGVSAGQLQKTIWSCTVPCVDAQGEAQQAVYFGWCGQTVLDEEMLTKVSVLCRSSNHDPQSRATRTIPAIPGYCESAGAPCEQEGPAFIDYSCDIECPGRPIFRYSSCAISVQDAWEVAKQICPDPKIPDFHGWGDVCESVGKTPCSLK